MNRGLVRVDRSLFDAILGTGWEELAGDPPPSLGAPADETRIDSDFESRNNKT